MKKLLLLIISMILMINIVLAIDCQYKQSETYQVEEYRYYLDNKLLNEGPTFEYQDTSLTTARFKVYNPYDFDITIAIPYKTKSNWYGDGSGSVNAIVSANEFAVFDSQHNNGGPVSEPDLQIIDPAITKKFELVSKQREICKLCLGKNCLNDGAICSNPTECGGNFCIEGVCSNSEKCYNNDCKCSTDKIQCDDNTKCVLRNSIELDTKTICNKNEECVSGYIDPNTKLCAKSPSQIQKEKDEKNEGIVISIIVLSIIIVVGIGIYLYLKNKNEEEKQKTEYAKQKTIQKQMEFVVTKLHTKNLELEKIKNEIHELKIHKKIKEDEVRTLKNLKEKESALFSEIQGIEQQIDEKWENLKPFPDAQAKNRLVIINPYLGGYKCFYNKELELKEYPTSSLVHRWVWKHKTGSWPKPGYHIHHVDGDKYNNDPNNLEEIDGYEHFEMHRSR
jgi:flagellar basal body-associated protein FliL